MMQSKLFTRAVAPRSAVALTKRGFAQTSGQTGYNKDINKKFTDESLSKKIGDVVDNAEGKVADYATQVETSLNEGWEQTKKGVKKASKMAQETEAPIASTLKQAASTVTETIKDTAKAGAEKIGINTNESATEIASDVASKAYSAASTVASTVASMAKGTAEKLGFSSTESVKDTASSAVETAKQAGQKVADMAKGTVEKMGFTSTESIKDTANSTMEAAKQTGQAAASTIKENASQAMDQAKKVGQEYMNADAVKDTMNNIKGTLKTGAEKLGNMGESVKETVSSATQSAKDTVKDAVKGMPEFANEIKMENAHKLASTILGEDMAQSKVQTKKDDFLGIDQTGAGKTMDLNAGEIDMSSSLDEAKISKKTEKYIKNNQNYDSNITSGKL